MITDSVDGWLARRLDQETALGLYLDPVVDKIVIVALFYELARAGLVNWAVPHLFLTRELLQNAVRAAAATRGAVVGSNWMGKAKALLQIVLITWGLLIPTVGHWAPELVIRHVDACFAVATWTVVALAWSFLGRFLYLNRRLFGATPD